MYVPDAKWRCTEDLKVILIAKQGRRLSRQLALPFFRQFGKLTGCHVIQSDKIACGVYTTEEDAEKALIRKDVTLVGGIRCDVTTFKAGNRKIYINPVTLSEQAYRSYFESNYGEVLRFEKLPGLSSAFILFLKVDSAVACRNRFHSINGMTVRARPGCNEAHYQPDRSTMYEVEPKSSNNKVVAANWAWSSPNPNNSAVCPYNQRRELSQSNVLVDFPQFKALIVELKDISLNEIDGWNKRFKTDVSKSDLIKKWRISQEKGEEEVKQNRDEQRGDQTTVVSPTKEEEEKEEVKVETEEEKRLKEKQEFEASFPLSEKELRREERRKALNLPPMEIGPHYVEDEDGFPIFHKGKYITSILRDGRFRIPHGNHVLFNTEKNTVKIFERADYEYKLFGPKGSRKAKGRRVVHDVEGWEDGSEIDSYLPKEPFPHNLNWPFKFPSKPGHFPLMDNSTFNDNSSLQILKNTIYMDHLQDRWNNTKHNEFFTTFAPFLRESCTICKVKLDGPKKQFEHIFTRPHLANMNRQNVKYTPTDFTFWNNLLLHNFHTGVKKRSSR